MASKNKSPEDIFLWSAERVPGMVLNIDLNNPNSYKEKLPTFSNTYINASDILRVLLRNFKFQTMKELLTAFKEKINSVLDLSNPQNLIFIALDGTKPAALIRKEKELYFNIGDYSGSYVSINHFLPQSEQMISIQEAIKDIIGARLNRVQGKNQKIVFSDAAVAGDASYKINDFIKNLRAQPKYEANTTHCMVDGSTEGFLNGLVSHELHFYNLNCSTFNTSQNVCLSCQRTGHLYNSCLGKEDNYFQVEFVNPNYQLYDYQEFRKMMEFQFQYLNFQDYNLEKVLDDFVLLVVLQGHVAIPKINYLPTLEGGLDTFLYIYKRMLPHLGFFTDKGAINQVRLGIFFKEIGILEDTLIKNYRRECEVTDYKNTKAHDNWKVFVRDLKVQMNAEYAKEEEERIGLDQEKQQQLFQTNQSDQGKLSQDAINEIIQRNLGGVDGQQMEEEPREEGQQQQEQPQEQQQVEEPQEVQETLVEQEPVEPVNPATLITENEYCNLEKIKSQQFGCIDKAQESFEDIQIDYFKYCERFLEGISFNEVFNDPTSVSLSSRTNWEPKNETQKLIKNVGEKDFKRDFYLSKFKISMNDLGEHVKNLQENFIACIHWSFSYFFIGYTSWQWAYVYPYAPFFSDIHKDYDKMKVIFEKGSPLKALDYQLVMTHGSQVHTLPKSYQHLHSDSEIMDLWPFQYSSDFNWNFSQQVTIIPPFDINRLLAVTERYESILEEEEIQKNRFGKLQLFTQKQYLAKNQVFREKIEYEVDGLHGEVFHAKIIMPEKTKANGYAYLPPPTPLYDYQLTAGVEAKQDIQFDYDQAEILDQIQFRRNQRVRHLERTLHSYIDKAEQYNQGLITDEPAYIAQAPPQQQHQAPNYKNYQQNRTQGGYQYNNRQPRGGNFRGKQQYQQQYQQRRY